MTKLNIKNNCLVKALNVIRWRNAYRLASCVLRTASRDPRDDTRSATVRLLTLYCGLVVFSFLMVLPRISHAALLYTSSANQVVYQDQTFLVEFYLDTQDKEINTVDLTLDFNKNLLEVEEASAGRSDIDLWVKSPEFSNDKGTIHIIGGITGGAKSNKLHLFSATFKAIQTGTAKINLDHSSSVLLSDGQGNQAPLLFTQLSFPVNPSGSQPAKISSPTHPDQNLWYKEGRVVINFEPKPNEEYSYSFSSNPEMIPDETVDEVKELTFDNLPDNIYYFKLNSREGRGNWQEAGVFRVQIDKTPPLDFAPAVGSDPSVFDGQPFVSFATSDLTSGVTKYQVKLSSEGEWTTVDTTYFKLPGKILGNQIAIKVVDAAGNEQIKELDLTKYGINREFTRKYLLLIIGIVVVGIGLLYVIFVLYRKLAKKYTAKIK